MIPRYLAQAKGRLKLCQRALTELSKVDFDAEDFQIHWQDFLVQWKGTYMKVQQAAKSTPQELQWFGGVNTERRGDPLLRWLYEARNDEEHFGLTDSASFKPAKYSYKVVNSGSRTVGTAPGDASKLIDPDTGDTVAVLESFEPQVDQLQEVTERDGKKKVPAPTRHLGKPIPSKPKVAASLGLRWIEAVVAKAEEMHRP